MASRPIKKLSRAELEAELLRMRHCEALFIESEAFSHTGNFEWNIATHCFESCSRAFADILDLTVEAVLDPQSGFSAVLARVHPGDRRRYQALFDSLGKTGLSDIKFRIRRENGAKRDLYQVSIASPGIDRDSSIVAGILHDSSAHAGSESDIRFGESLALQSEQISEIGSFLYDESEKCYLYTSPGCARIYGMSEQEYIEEVETGEDDLSDVHELDLERLRNAYEHYYNTGEDCRVEFRIFRQDGEIRWIRELDVALEMKEGHVSLTRGVMQDITEQKNIELELRAAKEDLEILVAARTGELAETVSRLEDEIDERRKVSAELEFLANHDPLTGLPSLRLCKDRLERALVEARRNRSIVAVMFLDLDGFKAINDTYGHEFGDSVLRASANRIRAELRETDTVARIGGDEFLVILSGVPDLLVVERIAASLVHQLSQPIRIEPHEVVVSASIGVALYPDDASDSDELIRVADKAMYLVKNSGKNSFGFACASRLN